MSFLSHLICSDAQLQYAKPDPQHTFRGRLDGTRQNADDVVYEDELVFAFRHRVDPTLEHWWETHVVIIPKSWVPTIFDIGLAEQQIWLALVAGIQKVALKLGLYKTGFMIRMGVLAPYQHTEHVHIHILSGKHESPIDAPLPDVG